MNYRTRTNTFYVITFVIVVIASAFAIANVFAAEDDSQPVEDNTAQNQQIAQNIMVNTPPVGTFGNSWDDYVASINWADYSDSTAQNQQIAQSIMVNTPPVGTFGNGWDDYVAGINWADYASNFVEAEQPPYPTKCIAAC